jgi:hypothetical protein
MSRMKKSTIITVKAATRLEKPNVHNRKAGSPSKPLHRAGLKFPCGEV